MEYDNKSKVTEVCEEHTKKRQKTDIQSNIKETIDNLFSSDSKLTGAYFTENDCSVDLYAFSKKVQVEGNNGWNTSFKEIIQVMLHHSSSKLKELFYKVLLESLEEFSSFSDVDVNEKHNLLPIFELKMKENASECIRELLVNAVNLIKNC